jgi:hypothetical protein
MYLSDLEGAYVSRHEQRAGPSIEEQKSLPTTESERSTPECAAVQKPIEEGIYLRRIWGNPNRVAWFIG